MEEEGKLVAIACETTGEVVVIERDGGRLSELVKCGGFKRLTVVVVWA